MMKIRNSSRPVRRNRIQYFRLGISDFFRHSSLLFVIPLSSANPRDVAGVFFEGSHDGLVAAQAGLLDPL